MINRYLHGIFIQFHTFYVTSIPPSGIITENLRLACLHCSETAVVGWHLARLVNPKVRVRTPVKPEVSFHTYVTRINESQMVGTVCNECLGDILA